MNMTSVSRFLFIFCFISPTFADDVAGFWKHNEHPVWIEISLKGGSGTIVRNDKFPEREGRQMLKDVTAHKSKKNQWSAEAYVEKMQKFVTSEITLPTENRMLLKGKVGFFSRTTEWLRVDGVARRD